MKFYKINPLFILFLLNTFTFLFWFFKYSDYIPLFDQLFYLQLSKETFEQIKNFDISLLFDFYGGIGRFLNSYLPFILISPFYAIFGFSINFYLFVNWLMLNLSFLLIYKIAKELYDSKIGIIASFIFLTFPAIYWFSKFFFLEIIATPFLLLTFYLLIKTQNYKKTHFTILYGIVGSITILLKNATIIPIFLLHFYWFFKSKVWQDKQKSINFILSTFFFFTILLAYLFSPIRSYYQMLTTNYLQPLIIAKFFLLFPKYLIIHLGVIWFAFFFLFLLMRKNEKKDLTFFVIFLSYFLLFSLPLFYIPSPQVRMSIMILPFFAIFLANFLFSQFKKILIFLILLALIYMVFDLNFILLYNTKQHLEKEEYSLLKSGLCEKFQPSTFSPWISFTGEEKGFFLNVSEVEKILQKTSNIDKPKCFVFSLMLENALEFLSTKQNYSISFEDLFLIIRKGGKVPEIEKKFNCFIVSDIEFFFLEKKYCEFLDELSKNLEKNPNFEFVGKYFPKKTLEVKVYVKK